MNLFVLACGFLYKKAIDCSHAGRHSSRFSPEAILTEEDWCTRWMVCRPLNIFVWLIGWQNGKMHWELNLKEKNQNNHH